VEREAYGLRHAADGEELGAGAPEVAVEQSRQSSGDSSQRETDERQPETGSASAPRGSGVTGWRQWEG
jgi:hypothetical protein